MLSYISTEYLLSEEQRKTMYQIYKLNEKKKNIEYRKSIVSRKNTQINAVFEQQVVKNDGVEQKNSNEMVVHEDSVWKKWLNRTKSIFHK